MSFSSQIDELVNAEVIYVDVLDTNKLTANQIAIAMPFAKELILNHHQKELLKEKAIIKIELVYTQFKTSSMFNQKQLNEKRLLELKKHIPDVFEFPLWDFELISQTQGNSREECTPMFHGFIITFRPNSSVNTLKEEAQYLQNFLATTLKNDSILKDSSSKKIMDIKTHYDKQWGYIHDTIWGLDTVPPPSPPNFFYNHSLYKDSTVLNAMNRNKNWDDFIVVTDVTGSMSPYIAQVFVWLKEQSENKQAKYFVFFNDGDDKPSKKKNPMETKGIYVSPNTTLDSIMNVASWCMERGSGGGEGLENDVEAIIEGLKYFPRAKEVVLVADNFESMRDYKFLDKIKTPVHVIICGGEGRINIQYLDLAKRTKGSIHTKTQDIFNLDEVEKGEHIFINKKEYIFHDNKFHFIYN
ncbi:MAG: hypothetical protein KDD29_00020 [Flavobacteriales bacterium]|nr:hypothetical protein [Flavobacteriales bacterium]